MADSVAPASNCQPVSSSYIELKNAYSSAKIPQPLVLFNIGTILTYFLETRADFKAIRANSFELFTSGHVNSISLRQDEVAKKVIIVAQCLAQMRQQTYKLVLMLNDQGDIIHASCGCPAGSGPNCTCKHVAALCYALEDFNKIFVLPEDIPSCTDKLEAWNKPRETKLPAAPVYDIDFERKRFGKIRKEKRTLKGNPPDYYQLNLVCESDKTAAQTFISELQQWSTTSQKGLLMTTVVSGTDPVETRCSVNPLYEYMARFHNKIEEICKSASDTQIVDLKSAIKVNETEQALIQTHTLLQSRTSDWFSLRKFRITGSLVSRVCNFYTFKKSNPEKITNSIFEPSQFSSAAMKYGLEFEPVILERYELEKAKEGNAITLQKLGLMIDTEHGFLAASPDCGVKENGSLVGIVECKTAVKWSKKTVSECVKEITYPLKSVSINQNGNVSNEIKLKPNHAWYHQIQLQLFVCRSFSRYCDLVLLHPESSSFHCQRFELNQEWVTKFLPKFEDFFNRYMAPKIVLKYK